MCQHSATQEAEMSLGSESGIRNPAVELLGGSEVWGSLIADRTDSRLGGSLADAAL